MRRGIVPQAIAVACVLLTGPQPAAQAENAATTDAKRLEAEEHCRDKSTTELIILLGHESYHHRQLAQERLQQLMEENPNQAREVEQSCYQAFRSDPSPEVRMRSLDLLAHFATNLWSPVGFLGIAVAPLPGFGNNGQIVNQLRVSRVQESGPAAQAGLRADDIIVSIDGRELSGAASYKQFERCLSGKKPGDRIEIVGKRGAQTLQITVVLSHKPRGTRNADGQPQPVDPRQCLKEYLNTKKQERAETATQSESKTSTATPRK